MSLVQIIPAHSSSASWGDANELMHRQEHSTAIARPVTTLLRPLQQCAALTLRHDCLTGLLMNGCQSQVYFACAKAGLCFQPDLKGGVLMAFLICANVLHGWPSELDIVQHISICFSSIRTVAMYQGA